MSSDLPISARAIAERITELRKAVSTAEDQLNRLREELEWWEKGQRLFVLEPEPQEPLPLNEDADEESAPTSSNGTKPTLRGAILAVLGQEPRKTWKTEAIIAELQRRDWMPGGEYADHHVRSMVAQMHRKGQARRMGRGMYRLPPDPKETL